MSASPASTRRWRRSTVRLVVRWDTGQQGRDDVATTLGAGGLFVATPSPPVRGTAIRLRFRLRVEDPYFETTARVVFSHTPSPGIARGSPGMGLELVDPGVVSRLAAILQTWPER